MQHMYVNIRAHSVLVLMETWTHISGAARTYVPVGASAVHASLGPIPLVLLLHPVVSGAAVRHRALAVL